jgi:hypothetical protein
VLSNLSRLEQVSEQVSFEIARIFQKDFLQVFSSSEFDGHFDPAAQRRMISGCRKLDPFLEQYRDQLGKMVLECGPYLNPAMPAAAHPEKTFFYLDIDPVVIQRLRNRSHTNTFAFQCNLDLFEDEMRSGLHESMSRISLNFGREKVQFDSLIISQVRNYVDYKTFFSAIHRYMRPGALVFINNVIDYGIPALFSRERPKSADETILELDQLGFDLLEMVEFETPYPRFQPNDRHILVFSVNEWEPG